MRLIASLFFLFSTGAIIAQPALPPRVADSLWKVWEDTSKHDTIRLKALEDYSWDGYLFHKPDSAFYYAQMEYDYAKKHHLKKPMANALVTQGVSFYIRTDYEKALSYYERALKINKEINYRRGINSILTNMAGIYETQGNYRKAIEYFSQSLKMDEQLGNKRGVATSYLNIGAVFKAQGNYKRALEYYHNSLKIVEELKEEDGVAVALNNIGVIHAEMDDYEKAKEYFLRCIAISNKTGNKEYTADAYNNLGQSLKDLKQVDSALVYLQKGYECARELGDRKTMSATLNNMSMIYFARGDFDKAMKFALQARDFASEIGAVGEMREAAYSLYKNYRRNHQFKDALEAHELFIKMRDSMESADAARAVMAHEFRYEYGKKTAADSIREIEKDKVHNAEIKAQDEELARQRTQQIALYGGLAVLLVFGGFMYNRYRVTQKQKHEIEEQKHLVEEKNKEISDSIKYAKRLQEAILPSRYSLTENLKNGFVLFKPKDIVSGDFYWLENFDGTIYFAAADCTGHGVPGAMVSVVCSNALSKALLEENIPDTGKLLDRTRELVVDRFSKSGGMSGAGDPEDSIKDGMDISLCALKGNRLQWSGANNPLWLIRKSEHGTVEFIETKPDKQPVGKSPSQKPFTAHTIELQAGDTMYIFTDGFQDQFGGDSGKKFKASHLKDLLLSMQDKPMEEQKDLLNAAFEKWRGNLEQVDDVCIIGVRI